jgi:hypothetical protein
MKKEERLAVLQLMAVFEKHRRINKLSQGQWQVLFHLAGNESRKEQGQRPFPPLTDQMSLKSLNYQYKNLIKKGFLQKNANGYSLTDQANKMFKEAFNDPGTEFNL